MKLWKFFLNKFQSLKYFSNKIPYSGIFSWTIFGSVLFPYKILRFIFFSRIIFLLLKLLNKFYLLTVFFLQFQNSADILFRIKFQTSRIFFEDFYASVILLQKIFTYYFIQGFGIRKNYFKQIFFLSKFCLHRHSTDLHFPLFCFSNKP